MLELYQAEGCPYSEKARQRLSDLGVSYTIHNPRTHEGETLNEQTHDELLALGGEDQIPFLVDHEREATIYESDDIVAYLDQHYA